MSCWDPETFHYKTISTYDAVESYVPGSNQSLVIERSQVYTLTSPQTSWLELCARWHLSSTWIVRNLFCTPSFNVFRYTPSQSMKAKTDYRWETYIFLPPSYLRQFRQTKQWYGNVFKVGDDNHLRNVSTVVSEANANGSISNAQNFQITKGSAIIIWGV